MQGPIGSCHHDWMQKWQSPLHDWLHYGDRAGCVCDADLLDGHVVSNHAENPDELASLRAARILHGASCFPGAWCFRGAGHSADEMSRDEGCFRGDQELGLDAAFQMQGDLLYCPDGEVALDVPLLGQEVPKDAVL